MKSKDHYQALVRMYESAAINLDHFKNSKMELESGLCRIHLPISQTYFHAMHAVHGAVYFKLLDDGAFFAVQSLISDYFIVTSSFNLQLVRPSVTGSLHCEGKIRFKGRNIFTAEASLTDDKGKEIAFGSGNFVKTSLSLESADGYSAIL